MRYIVKTNKTFAEATHEFPGVAAANGFDVLHVYNPQETMGAKGIEINHEIRTYDIANPACTKQLLDADLSFSMVYPCRITIWEDAKQNCVKIGMISPGEVLEPTMEGKPELVSLIQLVREMDTESKRVIDLAAA